jgi:hypothetical protein
VFRAVISSPSSRALDERTELLQVLRVVPLADQDDVVESELPEPMQPIPNALG